MKTQKVLGTRLSRSDIFGNAEPVGLQPQSANLNTLFLRCLMYVMRHRYNRTMVLNQSPKVQNDYTCSPKPSKHSALNQATKPQHFWILVEPTQTAVNMKPYNSKVIHEIPTALRAAVMASQPTVRAECLQQWLRNEGATSTNQHLAQGIIQGSDYWRYILAIPTIALVWYTPNGWSPETQYERNPTKLLQSTANPLNSKARSKEDPRRFRKEL